MPSLVSYIVVNYNGKQFLADCFKSIAQHTSIPYEIILVDNASTDGSVQFIEDNFPQVTLIKNEDNLGFTGGNNIGAKVAQGDFFLLLNNDTKLLSDIAPMVNILQETPNTGAVGGRLYYGDGRQQCSIGLPHTPHSILLSWLGLKSFHLLPDCFRREVQLPDFYACKHSSISWLSGAFLMIPKNIWQEVQGFDNTYFMYLEDVDICKRIRKAGYTIKYTPEAEAIHYEGGNKEWVGSNALSSTFRSYLIFTTKFYGKNTAAKVQLGLRLIFKARAYMYGIMHLITGKQLFADKSMAFKDIAKNPPALESP